ncbi:substrate-binding periplasmic protein [Roseateles cavernae]|uniref:substrate-binding periplasmic protein n=1 Tax=Roseateles cavernae TaxID=3153578 RepID=UPI0032E3F365
MKMPRILWVVITALMLALHVVPGLAQGGPSTNSALDRISASGRLRVCIWPDYFGITYRHPRTQQLSGIDIDLSTELARELKVSLEYVESSFARLVEDLQTQRCDVGMFAVGMLDQRRQLLAFTRPYLQSDIYGVAPRASWKVRQWSDIDRPGVTVAVQAGTVLAPVMMGGLKQARIVVVRAPATREQALESGRVDVFMTDYPYSRRLLSRVTWARLISPPEPIFVLPYGYASKLGDTRWQARLDRFVVCIKRDGRLRAAAQRHGLSDIVPN